VPHEVAEGKKSQIQQKNDFAHVSVNYGFPGRRYGPKKPVGRKKLQNLNKQWDTGNWLKVSAALVSALRKAISGSSTSWRSTGNFARAIKSSP